MGAKGDGGGRFETCPLSEGEWRQATTSDLKVQPNVPLLLLVLLLLLAGRELGRPGETLQGSDTRHGRFGDFYYLPRNLLHASPFSPFPPATTKSSQVPHPRHASHSRHQHYSYVQQYHTTLLSLSLTRARRQRPARYSFSRRRHPSASVYPRRRYTLRQDVRDVAGPYTTSPIHHVLTRIACTIP